MALSIKAEHLFNINGFNVTNSLLSGFLVAIFLILFFIIYRDKIKLIPSKAQLAIEWVIESIYGLCKDVLGLENAKKLFPIIFTFFIFIILSNWFGILPFVGTIGISEHQKVNIQEEKSSSASLPNLILGGKENFAEMRSDRELVSFFRAPAADLNFTISLAILSFLLIQFSGITGAGFHYLGKYFDYRVAIGKGWKILLTPLMFIINFFWKTLELLLEFSKILSFSFRLFGNIFAGEVLLAVITTLTFGLLTLPFIGFEIFVGFIQAIVFIFLTMVFIKVSVETH